VLIIRRINCINIISGIRQSSMQPDGHLYPYGVTYTECCIDKIDSPDDEHGVARNM
jgi:hypothetical protein